jgi:hypothetical protein
MSDELYFNCFYKITTKNENHRGYQYKDGVNVLDCPFEEQGSCVPGGLYFASEFHIHNFIGLGEWLRIIKIPKGIRIVQDRSDDYVKYRASSIILCEKYPLYAKETAEKFPFLLKNKNYFQRGFTYACVNGLMDLAEWCVDNGGDDLNECFLESCKNKQLKMAKFCFNNGANNVKYAIPSTIEIAEWLIEIGKNINDILGRACLFGNVVVVNWSIKNGATDFNNGLKHACSMEQKECMSICIENGATFCKNCQNKHFTNKKPKCFPNENKCIIC